MARFSIKAVFDAVDKVSAPMKKMTAATTSFARRTEHSLRRAELASNRLSRSSSAMAQNMKMLIGAGGVMALLSFGGNSLVKSNMELDSSLQSLQAITGVVGEEFKGFEKQIDAVSKRQKIFAADTAKAFELVGSAKPELLANAEALGAVTEAAIVLGKAGKMSVEDAVNSLTISMNQFGAGAEEAASFVDILATAQQKGSGTISYLSQALVKSGGTLRAFGNSFEDGVAILEGFAKAGVPASESGTMLSGILSKLSKVQQKEFNPEFTKATDIINNLAKANLSYTDLIKLTDTEGAKWLTQIINQNDVVQDLTGNLNEAGNAQAQANIQTSSLKNRFDELNAAFKNAITSTDSSNSSMLKLKSALAFLADNMNEIISLIVIAGKIMGVWLAVTLLMNAGLLVQKGILAGLHLMKYVRVISMMAKAKGTWVAVQWALNAAMTANPIGLIIVAIGALIAVVVLLVMHWRTVWDWLNKIFDNKWIRIAMMIFTPLIAIPLLIARNWEKITEVLSGVWDAMKTGLKSVGLFIFEMLITPLEWILKAASSLGSDMATGALHGIDSMRMALEGGQGEEEEQGAQIYNRENVFNEAAMERDQNSSVMLNINNNNNSDISAKAMGAPITIKNTSMFQ